ncbi:hypothetical protein LOZ86_17110 [Pectobacterium parvum]|uniref:Uncharacterized protein n=1 Tax=Pectobacterium parvum TaxID=2778550 RepID=A0AAP9IDB3_9GAMM|nr:MULTISPECIES: hypothetical protein [Pectobacterium]GKW41883.1 hypothetical protein PEC301879_17410 [Pectobacterium carotovorum subsp. carotovorum]KFX15381.1 hypothetical protein KP17_08560 [Pectobacterium parvum]KHS96345.1 hypothetical protein RC88_06560 [Pectobacterium parvum]MBN3216360.1 hypothetical protein [Pectobacterium polaris]MCU1802570.1 hypothetical protein [Pectobacterium parvum]
MRDNAANKSSFFEVIMNKEPTDYRVTVSSRQMKPHAGRKMQITSEEELFTLMLIAADGVRNSPAPSIQEAVGPLHKDK